jgi:hypothetical protein
VISREQFIQQYAERSGTTVDELMHQRVAIPCTGGCDYAKCQGWQMTVRCDATSRPSSAADYTVWRCGLPFDHDGDHQLTSGDAKARFTWRDGDVATLKL